MIRNWDEHGLHMDFSNIKVPKGRPSDVDLWYIDRSGFLIIGEIKNAMGAFTDGQRYLLSRLVDNHKAQISIMELMRDWRLP